MDKSKLIDLCVNFIEKVNKVYPLKIAYLFGSYAKNTENNMSDIDIALLFGKEYESLDDALIRGEIIEMGVEFFKMPVDIVTLSKAALSIKYEVIKDGILIYETDPGIRVRFETSVLREYLDFKHYSDIYNEALLEKIAQNNFFGG